MFLVFIAEYPFARFFFGIPAWALGAVFVGIEVLQLLGERNEKGIVFLFVSIATPALSAPGDGPGPEPARGSPRSRSPAAVAGAGASVASARSTQAAAARSSPVRGRRPSRTGPTRSTTLPQPPAPTSSEHDQAELDELLEKISANGMDGLSADEKRRLNDISKRLRNRK